VVAIYTVYKYVSLRNYCIKLIEYLKTSMYTDICTFNCSVYHVIYIPIVEYTFLETIL